METSMFQHNDNYDYDLKCYKGIFSHTHTLIYSYQDIIIWIKVISFS